MSTTVRNYREACNQGRSALVVPASKTRLRLKQGAIALSIANLSFLYIWEKLLAVANNPAERFYAASAPDVQLVWALIADVCVVTVIVFAAFLLRRNASRGIKAAAAAVIALLSCFAAFQVLFISTNILAELGVNVWGAAAESIAVGVALFLIALLVFRPRPTLNEFQTLFLFLCPGFAILTTSTLWAYHTARVHYTEPSLAGMLPEPANRNRVVWMIFDELDERMLLDRPSAVKLPHFDLLRAESLAGTRVTSPAYDTAESVASLMTGKFIGSVDITRAGMQLIECNGHSTTSANFNSEPNVFKRARTAGFNVGISGWAYPYCRIVGSSLSACAWDPTGLPVRCVVRDLRQQAFYKQAIYLIWWQSRVLPFLTSRFSEAPEQPRMAREAGIETFEVVVENALRMLRDPRLNLVYLHFPVPHPPGIWDSKTERLTTGDSDYIDNLRLADEVLGRMRSALEQSGNWDRTTVLVSADHPFRPGWSFWYAGLYSSPETLSITHGRWQPYVPFLLKLPSQHRGIEYRRGFSSIISSDLLLHSLESAIKTPADAVEWLDAHASPHPAAKGGVCPAVQ